MFLQPVVIPHANGMNQYSYYTVYPRKRAGLIGWIIDEEIFLRVASPSISQLSSRAGFPPSIVRTESVDQAAQFCPEHRRLEVRQRNKLACSCLLRINRPQYLRFTSAILVCSICGCRDCGPSTPVRINWSTLFGVEGGVTTGRRVL